MMGADGGGYSYSGEPITITLVPTPFLGESLWPSDVRPPDKVYPTSIQGRRRNEWTTGKRKDPRR